MKNIISIVLKQLKYFFVNPFWISWAVILVVVVSLAANGYIWYWYLQKFKEFINVTPVAYSSAVLLLNILLAGILYPKEKMMSAILLGVGLLIQLFLMFFLKMSFVSGM